MTVHDEDELLEYWIDTINHEGRNLSKWEKDFMESITEQFERTHSLSEKQKEIVERIYAEKTP